MLSLIVTPPPIINNGLLNTLFWAELVFDYERDLDVVHMLFIRTH